MYSYTHTHIYSLRMRFYLSYGNVYENLLGRYKATSEWFSPNSLQSILLSLTLSSTIIVVLLLLSDGKYLLIIILIRVWSWSQYYDK